MSYCTSHWNGIYLVPELDLTSIYYQVKVKTGFFRLVAFQSWMLYTDYITFERTIYTNKSSLEIIQQHKPINL